MQKIRFWGMHRNGLDCTQKNPHPPSCPQNYLWLEHRQWEESDRLLTYSLFTSSWDLFWGLKESNWGWGSFAKICLSFTCSVSFQWIAVEVDIRMEEWGFTKYPHLAWFFSPPKSSTPQNIQIFCLLCSVLKDTLLSSFMSSSSFNKYKWVENF